MINRWFGERAARTTEAQRLVISLIREIIQVNTRWISVTNWLLPPITFVFALGRIHTRMFCWSLRALVKSHLKMHGIEISFTVKTVRPSFVLTLQALHTPVKDSAAGI